jgi:hypothetical protein
MEHSLSVQRAHSTWDPFPSGGRAGEANLQVTRDLARLVCELRHRCTIPTAASDRDLQRTFLRPMVEAEAEAEAEAERTAFKIQSSAGQCRSIWGMRVLCSQIGFCGNRPAARGAGVGRVCCCVGVWDQKLIHGHRRVEADLAAKVILQLGLSEYMWALVA